MLNLKAYPQILLDDASGRVIYIPDFLAQGQVLKLDQSINWHQDSIRMFDRTLPLPRLTAWYGDPEAVYFYSGIRNDPLAWTPRLLQLRDAVAQETKTRYNSVLANRYEQGQQSMSWHADDEASLGPDPTIASLSFGDSRRFVLKNRNDQRKLDIWLEDGSLLIMAGQLQRHWLHAIPKTRKPVGLRINLTFRFVQDTPTKAGSDLGS